MDVAEAKVILEGVRYLRIEGAFYCDIGCLFLFYGLYRALGKPVMSVSLTVISLGTRVMLDYQLSAIPAFGVNGIWWSVPIGWTLANLIACSITKPERKNCLPERWHNRFHASYTELSHSRTLKSQRC